MTEKVVYTLLKNGYKEMTFLGKEQRYRLFYDVTSALLNAVIFVDATVYTLDYHTLINKALENDTKTQGRASKDMLILCVNSKGILITKQMAIAQRICAVNKRAWIYDEDTDSLIVYENQIEEFYGLRRLLESASNVTEEQLEELRTPDTEEEENITYGANLLKEIKELPKATTSIILINVVVFILCSLTDIMLYLNGSVGLSLITGPDQLYRIITSMFLHVNATHLFSNMLLLYFTGEIVEKETKPLWFLIIYFFAGIIGCLAMFAYDIIGGHNSIMMGASGAVYGILGALLALVIFKRINNRYTRLPRVCFAILISVYSGFTQENIANWAHIGGVVGGFLACLIYCLITQKKHKGITNED